MNIMLQKILNNLNPMTKKKGSSEVKKLKTQINNFIATLIGRSPKIILLNDAPIPSVAVITNNSNHFNIYIYSKELEKICSIYFILESGNEIAFIHTMTKTTTEWEQKICEVIQQELKINKVKHIVLSEETGHLLSIFKEMDFIAR